METAASREPNTIEVLPQHKFDCRSLDAYLNQHLPGFGTEPEAKLTVAQYGIGPSLLQQKQICTLCFSSSGPGWFSAFLHPISFSAVTYSAGGSCCHWLPRYILSISNSSSVMEAL